MPKRKADREERLPGRSILEATADAFVDHRLLLQVALVAVVAVALGAWGPDQVRDGLRVVIESAPVRQVARVISVVAGVAVGGLQRMGQAAPPPPAAAPSTDTGAAVSRYPAAQNNSAAPGASAASPLPQTDPLKPPLRDEAANKVSSSSATPGNSRGAGAGQPQSDLDDGVLWSLEKDGETIRAVLKDRGAPGVDLQLFRSGRLWRAERWADVDAARTGAQAKRAELEKSGWTLQAIQVKKDGKQKP
jgi:hypothetical protein